MKKLAIILNDNFEEMEAIASIDILRRAGLTIDSFGTKKLEVTGSHQIKILADKPLSDLKVSEYDAIIIPGGPGVEELLAEDSIIQLVQAFYQKQKLVAAICAAPQILGKAGIIKGVKVTHYPTTGKFMTDAIEKLAEEVIIENKIITGAGPGAAIPFALAIVEYYKGKAEKDKLKKVLNYHH